jgi:hypothetical protein
MDGLVFGEQVTDQFAMGSIVRSTGYKVLHRPVELAGLPRTCSWGAGRFRFGDDLRH